MDAVARRQALEAALLTDEEMGEHGGTHHRNLELSVESSMKYERYIH